MTKLPRRIVIYLGSLVAVLEEVQEHQTTACSIAGKTCNLAHALIVSSDDLEISILAYLKQDQKSTLPKQVGSNTLVSHSFLA